VRWWAERERERRTGQPRIWSQEMGMSTDSKKLGLYRITAHDPLESGLAQTCPPLV
jgi:hypothetical protein